MQACRSIFVALLGVVTFAAAPMAWPTQAPTGTQVTQIPAVALSHDGQYLAWITARAGHTTLMIGGPSGGHARAVAIPGGCAESGLSWAPRWGELAVMTHCKGADGSPHSEVWVIDLWTFRASGRRPRKIADIDGRAHGMQWTHDLKRIAFLYRPDAATGHAHAVQSVAAVPVANGPLEILTSSYLDVREFRLSTSGKRLAFIAVPLVGRGAYGLARLYVQRARPSATPRLMVDPATASGPLHGLQITQLRWEGADWWRHSRVNLHDADTRIYFIGGRPDAQGAIAGDIYAIYANVTVPNHYYYWFRGPGMRAYWYQEWPSGIFAVTGRAAGGFQLAFYSFFRGGSSLRPDNVFFSVPHGFGDGRSPLAISTSWRGRPYVAYAAATATQGPEVHCGLVYMGAPPAVTSINADTSRDVSSANVVQQVVEVAATSQ